MRRHKAVARIFLFLSILNFTFAGLPQTPTVDEMCDDLVTGAEDMMEASERGHTQSEELPESLGRPSTAEHLQSRFDIIPAQSFKYPEDQENKKFFNKELTRKMKEYVVLGTIAGVFTGVANGMQKEIMGTVSPGAYVFTSLPLLRTLEWRGSQTSSDYGISLSQTVGRSVEPLNEHPQDQEDLVSRSLSNMGDEDLQMLRIISRRMLNSLD
jgi:hypothetical protein